MTKHLWRDPTGRHVKPPSGLVNSTGPPLGSVSTRLRFSIRCSRAASASLKIGLVRSVMAVASIDLNIARRMSFVTYIMRLKRLTHPTIAQ